jgi:hypothetical protein
MLVSNAMNQEYTIQELHQQGRAIVIGWMCEAFNQADNGARSTFELELPYGVASRNVMRQEINDAIGGDWVVTHAKQI